LIELNCLFSENKAIKNIFQSYPAGIRSNYFDKNDKDDGNNILDAILMTTSNVVDWLSEKAMHVRKCILENLFYYGTYYSSKKNIAISFGLIYRK
jgi:hypothetical protein